MRFNITAVSYLTENGIENPLNGKSETQVKHFTGCPGSMAISFESNSSEESETGKRQSHLQQWPVQLHLVSSYASYFKNSDLLLAADCVPFAYADFHKDFLNGKSLAIACPKLDSNKQVYLDKLITMINDSNLQSITVMIMQVPCCGGLLQLAKMANESADRKIPINAVVIGINGEIFQEELVS